MSVQEQLVQASTRNAEILRELGETEYAASALRQSQAYLSDLDREIEQCNRSIKQLELKTRSEHKDHKKYEESTVRRFFYGAGGKKDKFQEKASKEEREYVEALNAEYEAKSRRDEWTRNREVARKTHAELEQINQRHHSLQAELDAMYNSIFSGPTPDVPGEDQKEWAFREARDGFAAARQRHDAESQAFKCLIDADKFMLQALHSLADARSHSQMDMFGGGTLTDMMERDALSKAKNATDKVGMLVSQAQRLSPGIGRLGQMSIAQGHLSDVFFDNIFSDMAMHDEIKRSQAQCEHEARNLKDLLERARVQEGVLRAQTGEAAEKLEWARRDLQQIRQEAFQRLAAPPSYDESASSAPQ